MSVPRPKRAQNKLQALKDSEAAVAYIVRMCQNEKCFPKRVRWTIATRLMDAGIELLMNIRESNRIKPKDEDEYRYRLDKSFDAIMCFEKLWALLDLSERTLCIPVQTLGTCSDLLYKAETITVAWRRSDFDKFKKQYNIK